MKRRAFLKGVGSATAALVAPVGIPTAIATPLASTALPALKADTMSHMADALRYGMCVGELQPDGSMKTIMLQDFFIKGSEL